jgi:hypothetical protein
LRLSDASGKGATSSTALGVPGLASGASAGAVVTKAFESSDAKTGGTAGAPQLLSAPPNAADPNTPVLLSGAQSQIVSTGDFVGLTEASCAVAVGDSWLVGGSTAVGRTTLVLLSNPSEVPASVRVQIFGEGGEVTAPGMSGITVAPHGERVLSLAGFAPGLASPVVHVSSRGGLVVATLQQSTVRGLQAGGIDLVGAVAAPTTMNVIPGVVVAGSIGVQSLIGQSGFADLQTVLRVFVPGAKAATAKVTITPDNGTTAGRSLSIPVDAGKVVEIPIDELADGSYSVTVRTTVPAVVGIRVATSSAQSPAQTTPSSPTVSPQSLATDFAWLASAPQLDGDVLASIAPGFTSALHLVNPGAAPVVVTLTSPLGVPSSVTVPAGLSALVDVDAGGTYRLSGLAAVFASVSAVSNGGIAGYPVLATGKSSSPLTIYP